MFIKQVSIFIENKSGKIADVVNVLGENDIDICAFSIADTTDFGIARLITNDPVKSAKVLKDFGVVVKVIDVIGVIIPDTPGGLAGALDVLRDNNIDINYTYAFIGKNGKNALMIMKTTEPEKAAKVLTASGFPIIDADEIYN